MFVSQFQIIVSWYINNRQYIFHFKIEFSTVLLISIMVIVGCSSVLFQEEKKSSWYPHLMDIINTISWIIHEKYPYPFAHASAVCVKAYGDMYNRKGTHFCKIPDKLGESCETNPCAHFTDDFAIRIQIQWQIHTPVIQLLAIRSLQILHIPRQQCCRGMCKKL